MRQFVFPSLPWYTDLTQFQGKCLQGQHPSCIIYSPSWGVGWWSKNIIKHYVKKRRLYQHWPGSFIRECIIMVIPTRNGTFLNTSLQKQQKNSLSCKIFWSKMCVQDRTITNQLLYFTVSQCIIFKVRSIFLNNICIAITFYMYAIEQSHSTMV